MSVSLKVVSIALGATGVTGGVVGTTLWQTGVLNTTSTEYPFVREGDCNLVELLHLARNLQFEALRGGNYTAISCKDINSKSSTRRIASEWAGWFPKDVLTIDRQDGFEKNFRLTLEIDTKEIKDNLENKYKTTFTLRGDKLNTTLVGKWESPSKEIPNQSLITIKMASQEGESDKIFHLLFIGNNR